MRVIVTGSQGFLGRYLIQHLLETGQASAVLGLGRSDRIMGHFTHSVHWGSRRVLAPLPPFLQSIDQDRRYRYRALDLLDRPALIQALRAFRPEVVFHLAASLRDENPDDLVRNNVGGTIGLLEAIVGAGIEAPRVVLGSSGAVYGVPEALPITEDQACNPIDYYSASKRAAENMSGIAARQHGIPSIWARIFNPVGPGQDERHLCGWLARQAVAITGGVQDPVIEIGPLDTTRDFVDVRDVAVQLAILADRGDAGCVYNLASGEETPTSLIFDQTLRLAGLGSGVTIARRPGRPSDVPRAFADMSRLGALGWKREYGLAESISDLLAYYREDVAAAANGAREAVPCRAEKRQPLQVRAVNQHKYRVRVEEGLLDRLPETLQQAFPGASMVVLTDDRVDGLYACDLVRRMDEAGISTGKVVVPQGEASKDLAVFQKVIEDLYRAGFARRSVLVCVGGGLVTDLGGYVASSYMRGVPYVNVPTTLLAQHDSAIGGKVAVNATWAKNFVGAFHHPQGVYADPTVLKTLPDREICAGIAEAIKVAMSGALELFDLLEESVDDVMLERDSAVLRDMVYLASHRKIELLDPDPYEVDLRRVLNLGHTFGHPLETLLGYRGLLHGEAVGFGIAVATAIALNRGECSAVDAERIFRLLDAYRLPPMVPLEQLKAAQARMREVRMIRAGKLNFVFPTGVGRLRIVPDLETGEVQRAIETIERHHLLGRCVSVPDSVSAGHVDRD